jgi:hypothetical protein
MSVESSAARRPALRLRADVPAQQPDRLSIVARPGVILLGVFFVLLGGASLELGAIEARLGMASGELPGPYGRVFGYWDPSLWPLPVTLGRIWAYFEEVGPTQGVVRWPSAIAGLAIGILLARRARLTLGPRAGLLVASAFFGSFALMDRSTGSLLDVILMDRSSGPGLALISGFGLIAAIDRLLSQGSGWFVGLWASLAFLGGGWPPLAVLGLATIVLGRKGSTWTWSMSLPVVLTITGWSIWALTMSTAEAWASALALPIKQPSEWGLIFTVIGLGMPWTPFALLARHRTIREGWSNGSKPLVIGWLQVAGASLIVGTIVPGLAPSALIAALAGFSMVAACCWDRIWAASNELPEAAIRGAIRLSLIISTLWFLVVLGGGGFIGFAIAYYRATVIIVAILSFAGFLCSLHAARLGQVRWALGGILLVSVALKLAHWGFYVPEWNYRCGAGPWGRAIGQWVPEKHPVYVLHSWDADLMFAMNRPVRQLRTPGHLDFQPGKGSKFVLISDSEYAEYLTWSEGWPRLLKVAEFEDELGLSKRILTRTDAPLIIERPYRKHDPKVE